MLSQLLLQVRSGRDRDAARLDSLATKLAASSRDILKNRASILTRLYSLSKDAGCNKENKVLINHCHLITSLFVSSY